MLHTHQGKGIPTGTQICFKYISTNLQTWISTYPVTLYNTTPEHFPPAQVSQKYAGDDDHNSGHASYMSSCAQSYGSFEDTYTTDEAFFNPPGNSNASSYADAVKQAQPPDPRSNPSGTEIEFTATNKELRSIITNLWNEVQELNGGIQTPSTTTEVTSPEPEITRLKSRMDTFESNITKWMNTMSDMLKQAKATPNSIREYTHQQPKQALDQPPAHQFVHTYHQVMNNKTPQSHQSKLSNTGRTSKCGDPMITQPREESRIQLFHEVDNHRNKHMSNAPQGDITQTNRNTSIMTMAMGAFFLLVEPAQMITISTESEEVFTTQTANQGQPSPQHPMTGSPQRLPAIGAQTYHT
jgi:hypothetical protein